MEVEKTRRQSQNMERREIAEHGKMYRALTSEPAAASAASGALAAAMHAYSSST